MSRKRLTGPDASRLAERVRLDRALLAMLARRGELNYRTAQSVEEAERRDAARRTPRRLRESLYPEDL